MYRAALYAGIDLRLKTPKAPDFERSVRRSPLKPDPEKSD